jgi:hypothetical protein
MADQKNINGVTYDEWLGQDDLPANFRHWKRAHTHWLNGDDIHWAIFVFKKYPRHQHQAREAAKAAEKARK